MSVSVFVASGVTSSLFASLLVLLNEKRMRKAFTFYAPFRAESDKNRIDELEKEGVYFLRENTGIGFHRTLWLSTHVDLEYLHAQSKTTPTLAINSAAILDIIPEGKPTNNYQAAKMDLYKLPFVKNIISGFFIQDVHQFPWASKGLHGDTSNRVFSGANVQENMREDPWWQKSYCVTPISILCMAIIRWLEAPEELDKTTIICSATPFRRSDLRLVSNAYITPEAKFNFLPAIVGQGTISDEAVILACRKAYMLQNSFI
ncbi:MAG: hypothetical protein K2Q45_06600 [Nitrosomonas sp.]|nr:hypothetical protein [Nitrosomonas sp.]